MIKRALISVYDKTGVLEFSSRLRELGVEIVSTGGTFKLLSENGIEAIRVESLTGFPEMLGGRVKTLHPVIFGGILADRGREHHIDSAEAAGIELIDLVVVNLYPFAETVKRDGSTLEEAIEQIDIGGVSLIRAAAKNFMHVDVLTNPSQYAEYIQVLTTANGDENREYAKDLAGRAFLVTSSYDSLISAYLSTGEITDEEAYAKERFPGADYTSLRYGENPHQKAVLVKYGFDEIFEVLHGKEISYNNLLDINAAYELTEDLLRFGTACAIVKHGNPCGAAVGRDNLDAYLKAFGTDTVSPFGGIVAFNRKLDFNTSAEVDKLFTEIILAPDFDEDALGLLKKKKNRRLVRYRYLPERHEVRSIPGGFLIQDKDTVTSNSASLQIVTVRKPDGDETTDMLFAETVCKHAKSNAVVFAKGLRTLGIGAGQPSRIDSTRLAVSKAKQFGHDLNGCVAASDAFFPFADGVIEIAESGAVSVIQPGGSVRDEEVIAEADRRNIAMAFTGIRHFKH